MQFIDRVEENPVHTDILLQKSNNTVTVWKQQSENNGTSLLFQTLQLRSATKMLPLSVDDHTTSNIYFKRPKDVL